MIEFFAGMFLSVLIFLLIDLINRKTKWASVKVYVHKGNKIELDMEGSPKYLIEGVTHALFTLRSHGVNEGLFSKDKFNEKFIKELQV